MCGGDCNTVTLLNLSLTRFYWVALRDLPLFDSMQTLVITAIRDQARITRSFDLHPTEHIDFTPGQIAILRVEGEEPAYFAFASAPDDADLEVLVKQKAGASSVIYDMKAGDQIELVGIAGHGFRLDEIKE